MANLLPGDFLDESDIRSVSQLLDELECSLEELKADLGNTEVEETVCLASRSAFVEFAAERQIDHKFSPENAERLVALLTAAKSVVTDKDYSNSIDGRLRQLHSFNLEPTEVAAPASGN